MKPRRTHTSNMVLSLAGGTEDNDLWCEMLVRAENLKEDDPSVNAPMIRSVWVPTLEERIAIGKGASIELVVYGDEHPPVTLRTTLVKLGRPADAHH